MERNKLVELLKSMKGQSVQTNKAISNHLRKVYCVDKNYLEKMYNSLWYGGRSMVTTNKGLRKVIRNTPGYIVRKCALVGASQVAAEVAVAAIPIVVLGGTIALAPDGAKTRIFSYLGKMAMSLSEYIFNKVIGISETKPIRRGFQEIKGKFFSTEGNQIIMNDIKKEVKTFPDLFIAIDRNLVKMRSLTDRLNSKEKREDVFWINSYADAKRQNKNVNEFNYFSDPAIELDETDDVFYNKALDIMETATTAIYYRDKIKIMIDAVKESLDDMELDLNIIGNELEKFQVDMMNAVAAHKSGIRTNLRGDFNNF